VGENQGSALLVPDGLRPAQLGVVVVGRVILGHVGATVADLAQRGYLRLAEVPGGDQADWVLTDLRSQASDEGRLLRYEATLLDGLFAGRPSVRLSKRGPELVPVLERVRAQIRRDAMRRGWLRRWHRDRRTERGDRLLARAQAFRRELRSLAAAGDPGQLAGLAPYLMVFGLAQPPPVFPDSPGVPTRREQTIPRPGTDRFLQSWLVAFAGCSATPRRGLRRRSSADFAREWSAPRDHHHSAGDHSHAFGHGTDYGHAGGSHGVVGGGHAGH
jgi:hypothetical protein